MAVAGGAMTEWFDDDAFWAAAEPMMFGEASFAEAPAMIEQVVALSGVEGGAALDLCCGPGRHAVELARRGFATTGVDRTMRFVEEARRRARDAAVELELVVQDMRTFRREGEFDLAINLFTSFGYFEDPEDDFEVLANLRQSLRPGGVAVLELMGKENLARVFRARDWREEAGALWLFERTLREGWSWLDNRWVVIDASGRREFTLGHRLYAGTELAELCRRAGFTEVTLHGGLDGSPYDQHAQRLVVVARR